MWYCKDRKPRLGESCYFIGSGYVLMKLMSLMTNPGLVNSSQHESCSLLLGMWEPFGLECFVCCFHLSGLMYVELVGFTTREYFWFVCVINTIGHYFVSNMLLDTWFIF